MFYNRAKRSREIREDTYLRKRNGCLVCLTRMETVSLEKLSKSEQGFEFRVCMYVILCTYIKYMAST